MLFKNLTPHFVREEPATDQQQKMEATRYLAGSFCGSLRLWATAKAAYFVIHESEEQL